jgi:transcriptional regulator of acetoin/glycerol metabolism
VKPAATSSAARMLGIGKTTLYRKVKQYNMDHAET